MHLLLEDDDANIKLTTISKMRHVWKYVRQIAVEANWNKADRVNNPVMYQWLTARANTTYSVFVHRPFLFLTTVHNFIRLISMYALFLSLSSQYARTTHCGHCEKWTLMRLSICYATSMQAFWLLLYNIYYYIHIWKYCIGRRFRASVWCT